MLEHLYLDDASALLLECFRVLGPGGVLRVALPDVDRFAHDLVDAVRDGNAEAALQFNQALNSHSLQRPRGVDAVKDYFGGWKHRWQPSAPLVQSLLVAAGFDPVVRRAYQEGTMPDLQILERRPESLFYEAYRPGLQPNEK